MAITRIKDPLRWQDQSEIAKAVWKYFNEIEAVKLVNSALRKNNLTLFDLYFALAKLRAKCEWVKEEKILKPDEIELYASMETVGSIHSRFGNLIPPGRSCEPDVICKKTWGEEVVEFVLERLGSDVGRILKNHTKIGLSFVEKARWANLYHQNRIALKEVEPYFSQLVSTTNVFGYLVNASSIVYELSNYVVTARGNAAVSAQLIEIIFQERFRQQFTCPVFIVPPLQDWFAFFEAPQDYTNFYVISAVANILLSFPMLPGDLRQYLQTVPAMMMQNPYRLLHLTVREKVWNYIKDCIDALMHQPTLTDNEKVQLNYIAQGKLSFRKPNSTMLKIFELMNHKGELDADRLSAFITKIGEAEKKSIRNILLFEDQVEALHYQGLGRPVCDEINQRWYDLEVVRCFELKSNEAISLIDKVREMLGIENRAEVQMYENDYDYPVWHHYNIPAWVCYSFMLPEDVSKTPPHIVDLLNNAYGHKQGLTSFNYRLKAAIYSGGLKVQDMGELSMEQITLLISPCAIYLYNAGLFIRSSDLVANTFDIEGGILKLLEKHFHDKVLPQPVQIQKNQLLLEHMFEDKVFLKDLTGVPDASPLQRRSLFSCVRREKKSKDHVLVVRKPKH